MMRFLKIVVAILILRTIIVFLLSLLPNSQMFGLNLDPLWTAVRVLLIAWFVVKVVSFRNWASWGGVGLLLFGAVIFGDWYVNATTRCNEIDTSRDANIESIAMDFIPILGDIKGLNEMATGCDQVTGERLETFRWFGIFGIVGLAEIGLVGDAARMGANGVEAGLRSLDDVAEAGLRQSDNMLRGFGEQMGSIGRQTGEFMTKNSDELAAGAGRAVNNAESMSANANEMTKLGLTLKICSFQGDTPIWTKEGLQPISKISTDDRVLAWHEQTGALGYYTVTATFVHLDNELVILWIDDERIVTTPNHPFMTADGGWIPAGELVQGSRVHQRDGAWGVVSHTSKLKLWQSMYNLEVAEAHTFFVGATGWLVHNECWVSKAGLVYTGIGTGADDMLEHVMKHLAPDPSKANHTVFKANSREELLRWIDEAWESPQKMLIQTSGTSEIFVVPMNRVVGTEGEKTIKFVIKDKNEVISAYPIP